MSLLSTDLQETSKTHGVDRATYLPQVDALRAIAALSVFFFHLYTHIWPRAELRPLLIFADLKAHSDMWRWIGFPSLFGYAGVPLFFVISGFCIHHSFLHSRRPFSYVIFMSRRFWRIYPAYLVAIAVALLLPGNPLWQTHHLPKSVILHLLFLHSLDRTAIFEISGPFWTLGVEFQFYVAYPLLLLLRRRCGIGGATIISLLLCILASALSHQHWIGSAALPLMPVKYWVQWCLGALVAERWAQSRPPLLNLPLVLGMWFIGFLFAVPVAAWGEWNYLAWAILAAAVIERWIRLSAEPWSFLVWVGTISYSFYLLHAMVIEQLMRWLPRWPQPHFPLALLCALPIVILASAAGYYLVEVPGIALGRRCVGWWMRRPGFNPSLHQ